MAVGVKGTVHSTTSGGIVSFQITKDDRGVFKKWLLSEYGKERTYDIEIKVHRKARTIDQNRLYWSLVRILSFEVYGEFGFDETIHEELLNLYAPRVGGKVAKRQVPKRSKDMTTSEFSQLVEGVFRELAMNGVEVGDPAQIGRYWNEWMNWRGTQGVDPLSQTYKDRADWMNRQTFCEACLQYLGPDRGTAAHIVSVGAGGCDELYNLMRLCDTCHVTIQHQRGWKELLERHPHVGWRYRVAHERSGVSMVEDAAQVTLEDADPVEDASESTQTTKAVESYPLGLEDLTAAQDAAQSEVLDEELEIF